ncbi:putative acetyltransferase [Austwickia chelonae NBRC 105200]|uniref:Putative acetyltransferase n=2 Tax=Austwickia TaxID=1184606 RepID=K6VTV3_9MICO|nr:putative acetyltransferase [Austwickia chelonae NBRC 105200]
MHTTPWPAHVDELTLRYATEDDIEILQSFRNDPDVNRFMVRTFVEPEQLRHEWLSTSTSETDYSCVAELDGQVVAMGFLDIVDGPGQPGAPRGTDGVIGYIVRPGWHRRGIATQLAEGLLLAAFEVLGLRRVTATANIDNPASCRVLERAGMRRESHTVKSLWHAELGWLDEADYALLAEEWFAAHR